MVRMVELRLLRGDVCPPGRLSARCVMRCAFPCGGTRPGGRWRYRLEGSASIVLSLLRLGVRPYVEELGPRGADFRNGVPGTGCRENVSHHVVELGRADEWHDAGQGQHAIGRIFGLTRAQRCGGLSRQEEATYKSRCLPDKLHGFSQAGLGLTVISQVVENSSHVAHQFGSVPRTVRVVDIWGIGDKAAHVIEHISRG